MILKYTAGQLHNNHVYIMNKGEWTNEEILKLIQTNREEKRKGKNYMKRIKQRCTWNLREKKEEHKT